MKLRIIFLIMALTNEVVLHGMVSRRIMPVSRFSSAATKAAAGVSKVSVITPVSFSATRSYTAPEFKIATIPKFFESSGSGQGKKYWGRKAIPLLGIAAGFYKFGDIMVSKYQEPKISKEEKREILRKGRKIILDNSQDLAVVDPEFYEACLLIMEDLGIKEPILFRVASTEKDYDAAYLHLLDNIIVLPFNYKKRLKSNLIRTIAHELEHHRQFHQYPGSFPGDFDNQDNDVPRKLETAADAVALDYLHCPLCLVLTEDYITHEPEETEHGYFTSKHGYATREDVALYRKRAREEGFPCCPAHKKYTFFESVSNRNIPFKDFLPTMKPSLPATKFKTGSLK